MSTKQKTKLRNTRFFLTTQDQADSYVKFTVPSKYNDEFTIKMADCNRVIHWSFPVSDKKERKKSLKKLKKFKELINKLYEELDS